MFTGLIQGTGEVTELREGRLSIATALGAELAPGESVAVDGVCLTAASVAPDGFSADVMEETRRRSSLGALRPGAHVNLELALRATDRLGGHIVQGHVDGVGRVRDVAEEPLARVVTVEADSSLLRYVVEKGSIAVDGVSLTVSALEDGAFAVSLIPETLARTTLGRVQPGDEVNLEVDVLAKYVERLIEARASA